MMYLALHVILYLILMVLMKQIFQTIEKEKELSKW
jgi:hypothetical protein